MADWRFQTADATTAQTWLKKWWMEPQIDSYFYGQGLIAQSKTSCIVEFPDLEQNQGYKHTFAQVRELSGAGITGDNTLEGNEEAPDVYDDAIELEQYRHAIRTYGRLSDQYPSQKEADVRADINELLRRWKAAKIDQLLFDALGTSLTKAIYGGDATSTATIEAGDYFTTNLISKCKAYAIKATPKIMPLGVKGKSYYIMLISPDQAFDLKTRDAAWAQAQREAMARGADNPIFSGAEGIWDGCVIHVHERVALATNWGAASSLNGATALFLGQQAGGLAYSKRRTWVEKDFDYSNKVGFAIGCILGVTKAVFNSSDNAVVGVRTYRTSN
jgi:N4-gp56 family major capsid protein